MENTEIMFAATDNNNGSNNNKSRIKMWFNTD